MGDSPNCLWGKMDDLRYSGSRLSLVELFHSDGPENHANLLNARPEDLLNRLPVLPGKFEADGVSRHTPV